MRSFLCFCYGFVAELLQPTSTRPTTEPVENTKRFGWDGGGKNTTKGWGGGALGVRDAEPTEATKHYVPFFALQQGEVILGSSDSGAYVCVPARSCGTFNIQRREASTYVPINVGGLLHTCWVARYDTRSYRGHTRVLRSL